MIIVVEPHVGVGSYAKWLVCVFVCLCLARMNEEAAAAADSSDLVEAAPRKRANLIAQPADNELG